MNYEASVAVPRLQDLRLTGAVKDNQGEPISLVGSELELGDVSPQLSGRIAVEVSDAAAGQFLIEVDGSSDGGLPAGRHSFRIIRRVNGYQEATYRIGVKVS